jgi:hypothetical protein
VGQIPELPGLADQVLQDIGHKDEEIRGEGVPLTEPILTADPIAGDTVKEDRCETRAEYSIHPTAPTVIEAAGPEDSQQAAPIHRIKGFAEIDFENNSGGFPRVAATEEVGYVDNVL